MSASKIQQSKEFFSVDEVATRWGVHPRTVRRAIKDGQLVAHKVRTRIVISAQDLLIYERMNRGTG